MSRSCLVDLYLTESNETRSCLFTCTGASLWPRGISCNLVGSHQTAASSQRTFWASSFFSCLRRSVRLMSFSMASTCRLRCFRYMPQARQYDSSSRPNLWLTVLLCISDLHVCRRFMGNTDELLVKCSYKHEQTWIMQHRLTFKITTHRKKTFFSRLTHFKCQKKKCPILWLVKAFFSRKRASGLSRYCSYFRT